MALSCSLSSIQSFLPFYRNKGSLFEQIFLNSPASLSVTDENGVILYANEAFQSLTGYSSDELLGNNLSLMKSSKNTPDFFKYFWEKLLTQKTFNGKIWNQHKDTLHALHSVSITTITLDRTYYLSTYIDVTKESELLERQHYLAYHDSHTGLANRSLFEDRLTHAINNASRIGSSIGILYCDLNEFKQINDDFGHATGDNVITEVAKRLQSFFRTNDTVARFGGDEFVIIVEHLTDNTQLSLMTDSLRRKIAEPMGEEKLNISMSIGFASFPQEGLTKEQLLAIADDRMYHNKNQFYGLAI